jgi:hypothetical protein
VDQLERADAVRAVDIDYAAEARLRHSPLFKIGLRGEIRWW